MNKLELKLSSQKSDDTLYTNWQISKLSNDFSEFYYKSVLLHDISIYLDQGILKKDVIIFICIAGFNIRFLIFSFIKLALILKD